MADARSRRCGANFSIGEDMVFQILQWLPVASLIRFKLVCKSWYSLIQTTDFINHHLNCHHHHHLNRKDSNNLILIGPNTDYYTSPGLNIFLLSDDNYQNSQNLSLPCSFPPSFIPDFFITDDWYIGICNGIICIRHETSKVTLWNPATRESRHLPESPFPLPEDEDEDRDEENDDDEDEYEYEYDDEDKNVYFSFGFVYDAKIDDYKVIRFTRIESSKKRSQVEVYALRTDSWRKIDFDLPLVCFCHTNTSLGNGIHCWCVVVSNKDESHQKLILSFDINKEVFGTISLPKEYRHDQNRHMLTTLGEELAYICCNHVSTKTENWDLKIFVLKDFSVEESWIEMYKIRLGSQIGYQVYPKGVSDNKIIFLLGNSESGKFCVVDPVMERLGSQIGCRVYPKGTGHYSWQVIIYKESLVSVKRISGTAKEGK